MNIFNFFKRKEKTDFTFVDLGGTMCNSNPPKRAKDVKTSFRSKQENELGEYKFAHCPGLSDYSRYGYIITAPVDIHIKANRAGSFVYLGDNALQQNLLFRKPQTMNDEIPHGIFEYQDNVPKKVWACHFDWKILAHNKLLAGLSLPPMFHGTQEMLENIYIYPGIVDFGRGFPTLSFVFSIKKKCEFVIKEGDPILHFIPMFQPHVISANYRIATELEKNKFTWLKGLHLDNFYRKNYQVSRIFKLRKDE